MTFTPLRGVANDVATMGDLAQSFDGVRLASEATRDWVKDRVTEAQRTLGADDTFLFFFAGHGFQIARAVEPDGQSEALALSDGWLGDWTISALLQGFHPKVTVVAIVDACHAAGVTSSIDFDTYEALKAQTSPEPISTRRATPAGTPTVLTLAASHESAATAEQANDSGMTSGLLTGSLGQLAIPGNSWKELWESVSIDAQLNWDSKYEPIAILDGPAKRRWNLIDEAAF